MMEHLPILLIVVPLMSAPLCVLIRDRFVVLGLAIAVSWLTFFGSCLMLYRVKTEGVVSYDLGGWSAPWGIEYRVDILSALVLLFVSAVGAIVITSARPSVDREILRGKQYLFYAMYLLCLTGLLGIVITGDMFNLFVFLEISSLSSYTLISLGKSRRALTAAFQYLVMGTVGATFVLLAIGLMYMMTGTLNMQDMAQRITGEVELNGQTVQVNQTRTILVAFAFLSVGVSVKMALFPLHAWLPNAYTYAPPIVTAFLAATATKVSVYVLLRFVFTIFKSEYAFSQLPLDTGLMWLSLCGILVASTVAIFQQDLKRMLAFSSVAQIGYMALGISFASVSGLTGGIVHMFNHAIVKCGLFLVLGCVSLRLGSVDLDNIRGMGRRMPITMFAWVVCGLGLIGVPVTAGFTSKWYLVSAALERGWWPVALVILFSSLLAVVYVWRVVEVAYFEEPLERFALVDEAPWSMLVPLYVLVAATIVFGIWTPFSVGIAQDAARMLLGVTP